MEILMTDTNVYDLVGAKEAADILKIGTPNFSHLRNDEEKKGEDSIFPQPVVRLACGPIWKRADIESFAAVYGTRKPGKAPAPKPQANGTPVNGIKKKLPVKKLAKKTS
jgi:hypothetical protein